jgi:hypothetical protein
VGAGGKLGDPDCGCSQVLAGWAVIALRGRDGEHDKPPGNTWALLTFPTIFLAYNGITWVEGSSNFSFGWFKRCLIVQLGNFLGLAACWIQLSRQQREF